MESKHEGAAFPQLPIVRPRLQEAARRGPVTLSADQPCEMCGAPVIAAHCKRICLRCGFMTGCSEGI
jgi:hypothetical protein